MDKSIIFKSKEQESAYYLEWAYVTGKSAILVLLAIGSLIVTYMIGEYVAGIMFPSNLFLIFIVKNVFVIIGFIAIDFGLANALSSASSEGKTKISTWLYAITSLLITIGLSLVSNDFVSAEMTGGSKLGDYNRHVEKAMVRDSTLKIAAFSLVKSAGKEEKSMISAAKKEGKELIKAAANDPTISQSWKDDYQSHKNTPDGWFWKCKDCPKGYRSYRNSILAAQKEAATILSNAKGHKQSVENTVAPTLSYSMSNDLTLQQVNLNVLAMEEERKERRGMINKVLLYLTAGAGLLALFITIELKSHRAGKFGQQITENHVMPIMMGIQIIKRSINYVINVVYSIAVLGETFTNAIRLNKRFVLDYQTPNRYQNSRKGTDTETDNGTDNRSTHGSRGKNNGTDNEGNGTDTETDNGTDNESNGTGTDNRSTHDSRGKNNGTDNRTVRACLECGTDISHKRKGAKFCGDEHRVQYHKFSLKK